MKNDQNYKEVEYIMFLSKDIIGILKGYTNYGVK